MTTNISGSAKIYTFPPRGRFAPRIEGEESAMAAAAQLPRGVKLVTGSSGWYHDAAIQEARKAERSTKN